MTPEPERQKKSNQISFSDDDEAMTYDIYQQPAQTPCVVRLTIVRRIAASTYLPKRSKVLLVAPRTRSSWMQVGSWRIDPEVKEEASTRLANGRFSLPPSPPPPLLPPEPLAPCRHLFQYRAERVNPLFAGAEPRGHLKKLSIIAKKL